MCFRMMERSMVVIILLLGPSLVTRLSKLMLALSKRSSSWFCDSVSSLFECSSLSLFFCSLHFLLIVISIHVAFLPSSCKTIIAWCCEGLCVKVCLEGSRSGVNTHHTPRTAAIHRNNALSNWISNKVARLTSRLVRYRSVRISAC